MRNLLAFLLRYNHWVAFVVLEVVSVVLLVKYNNYHGSVYFSAANAVSGKVYEWNSEMENFMHQAAMNEQLTRRNVFLETQNKQLAEYVRRLSARNGQEDTSVLTGLGDIKLVSAKVISNSVAKRDNFIVIDKGTSDGVGKDMGVVCGTGVVGTVYLASAHYSVVIPILNSHSNISVTIRKRGYFGYLQWNGGDSRLADVNDVPRHARFHLYDYVETSGYSSIFPPGLVVGQILHVYNSTDGLSYRLQVRLTTDFARLRDVCVIDNSAMKERLELLRHAQDSLEVKNER
ncbi:MAG: rod shape-determining protein MreC [Prevotella sp.]|nr:rod shape-determining protein MreC [Prevotella sp.]